MRTIKLLNGNSVSAFALLCFFACGTAANAFPAFAKKEKKPCAYCHIRPAGGGPRNPAGLWYKKHGLSFDGYTPEAAKIEADAMPKTEAAGGKKTSLPKGKPAKKSSPLKGKMGIKPATGPGKKMSVPKKKD